MTDHTITLKCSDAVLPNRKCSRCGTYNSFREIMYEPISRQLSCSLDCITTHCGHLLGIKSDGTERRCGDWVTEPSYCTDISATSVPMCLCVVCGKIVNLQ